MLNEQDNMVAEWKKQLYYEHNRDTSLRTSTTCRYRVGYSSMLVVQVLTFSPKLS